MDKLETENAQLKKQTEQQQQLIHDMGASSSGAAAKVVSQESASVNGSEQDALKYEQKLEEMRKELFDSQTEAKQKDDVIKILQDQLNALASSEADNSLDQLKTKSQSTEAHSLHECEWMQSYDEHGNVYFYNTRTQESSWDPPPGFS